MTTSDNSGRAVFVTGTGTDVGKTYAAALLVKKLRKAGKRASYFKAAVSGNKRDPSSGLLIPGDAQYVREISGAEAPLSAMCPYVYERAVSPHLAARLEGNPAKLPTIRERFFSMCRSFDFVTVEGAGGILCPVRYEGPSSEKNIFMEDIIKALGLSCLIVADAGLGTINAAGLTAFYLKSRGIPVKGMILNRFHPGDEMEEDNRRMCSLVTGLPVLACIRPGDRELEIDADTLASLYEPPAPYGQKNKACGETEH